MDAGVRKTSSPLYTTTVANGDQTKVLGTVHTWRTRQNSPITATFGPSTQQATTLQASAIDVLGTATDPAEKLTELPTDGTTFSSYIEVPSEAQGHEDDDPIAFLKGLRPDFHDYESFVTRSIPQVDGPSRSRSDASWEAEQALKNNPDAKMSIIKTVGYTVHSEPWADGKPKHT
jgi:hypothetical protein